MAIDETELSGRESGFGVGEEGAHLLDGGVLERAAKAVNLDNQGVGFGIWAEIDGDRIKAAKKKRGPLG